MFKIMIVDDEPSIVNALKKIILKKSDIYEVIAEAYSATEASEMVFSILPDIVITDIKMPGMSGLELVKLLAVNFPQIVVIVVSGYDDFKYVHDAFMYGVEEYILKPVVPDKLISLLTNLEIKLNNQALLKATKMSAGVEEKKITNIDNSKSITENMVNSIEKYVEAHIESDNSIFEICQIFSISQPYLSKYFRKYKSCTYNEFLINLKISKAKILLTERKDLLISTIAFMSGFSDQFYFSKVFKSIVGVTPSEHRCE